MQMSIQRRWNDTDRGETEILGHVPAAVPVYSTQISHRLKWTRAWAFAVKGPATNPLSHSLCSHILIRRDLVKPKNSPSQDSWCPAKSRTCSLQNSERRICTNLPGRTERLASFRMTTNTDTFSQLQALCKMCDTRLFMVMALTLLAWCVSLVT
jgi:hypothetical protein